MHDLRYNFGLNREELNAAAARVNNAIIFGTPEMVAEEDAKLRELLAKSHQEQGE